MAVEATSLGNPLRHASVLARLSDEEASTLESRLGACDLGASSIRIAREVAEGLDLDGMTNGRVLFEGRDPLSAPAASTPKSPEQLNPDLAPAPSSLLKALLTRGPAGRPGSPRAVIDAIDSRRPG